MNMVRLQYATPYDWLLDPNTLSQGIVDREWKFMRII